MSLGVCIFEGITIGALVPMVKGIIARDFSFAKNAAVFKFISANFPQFFPYQGKTMFLFLLTVIFTSALLKNLTEYLSNIVAVRQIIKALNEMMQLIFSRYLSFGKQFFDRTNVGYLYNVLLNFTSIITQKIYGLETMFT